MIRNHYTCNSLDKSLTPCIHFLCITIGNLTYKSNWLFLRQSSLSFIITKRLWEVNKYPSVQNTFVHRIDLSHSTNNSTRTPDICYIFVHLLKWGKGLLQRLREQMLFLDKLYRFQLALTNCVGCLYGRILTEVVITDQTQWCVSSVHMTEVNILPYRPTKLS